MEVTQTMKDEHQNILRVITIVEKECDAIEAGKDIDKEFFAGLSDFIVNYVDKYHHAKEEDILFQWMVKNADKLHCNPVPVMLYEHETGRDYLKKMREATAANDAKELVKYALGYCQLLREHIYKEDNVLYPMAEEALDNAQKEQITQQYTAAETKVKAEHDIDNLQRFAL